jgi:hypothetical protein
MLDRLVDCERHIVTLECLLVRDAVEEKTTATVTETLYFLHVSTKIFIQRELEPVFAFSVRGDETEDRPRELPPRVVTMSLPLNR